MKLALYYLTCANKEEADIISRSLLEKKLVACIKSLPVSSSFLWNGKIDSSKEVLLIMDSRRDFFEKIESEVRKMHSYDTFVLISAPAENYSKGVQEWIRRELK